ncbi:MAG TPA: YbjN domain-containing protein [Candidatus Pullichristensenella avicola]|nr:YbjN domain-containing protein [Candidatus Pullichristensenella avicola]
MKKFLALCLILALTLVPGALAAEFEPTDLFLEALEEDDFYLDGYDYDYEYVGIDSDGDEHVRMYFDLDGMGERSVNVFFIDTQTSCIMYLWDIIEFDSSDRDEVVEICNELNHQYRFARWYVMDDDTVNAQIDDVFRTGSGCGEGLVETLSLLVRVAETGYPSLEPYAA